jgi:hypothetical protein
MSYITNLLKFGTGMYFQLCNNIRILNLRFLNFDTALHVSAYSDIISNRSSAEDTAVPPQNFNALDGPVLLLLLLLIPTAIGLMPGGSVT